MRVIAGSLKGRRLKAPSWDGLRPTSDKLRETLFNILGPRVVGAGVLDGYAGTGAVGIEAISRGALTVVFVEHDSRAQALIAENLEACGVRNGYIIAGKDVRTLAEGVWGQPLGPGTFDLVFLDPPYSMIGADLEPALGVAGDLIRHGGLVVLEHAKRMVAPDLTGPLVRTRLVNSGDSALSFYERNPNHSTQSP